MRKTVLFIVAPNKFRDEELNHPKEVCIEHGLDVQIASKNNEEALGVLGAKVKVDLDTNEIDPRRYEAIVFVGGEGAMLYFNDIQLHKIARDAYRENKIIGAICIAPTILANSGILEGKSVTSFPSEEKTLESKGAKYTGEDLTVDGSIITANGPQSARKFGEKIVELILNNNKES